MLIATLLLGQGTLSLGFSSMDPDPALVSLAQRAGAKVYLVALPWRLVEPGLVKLGEEEIEPKEALEEEEFLKAYSKGVEWSKADELLKAITEAGLEPIMGVGWGWTKMLPQFEGGLFCPDYAGYSGYQARFILHVRAVVERYDGDGFLDAPGGLVVGRWLPERALNEAVVEAALGQREPSVFSALYSIWAQWNFLDILMREGIRAVRAADEKAKVGLLLQTDAPGAVSISVGKPTWDGALSDWAEEADFVVIETFPNSWLPEPLKTEVIAQKAERACELTEGKPVYVLTSYPSGPTELGFSEELQAEFLKGAVEAARRGGAEALLWHTIRSSEEAPVKPTAQDVADIKAIGKFIEADDISHIISMALSEPQRAERLLSVVRTIENFTGLLRLDGSEKPAWEAFVRATEGE